MVFTHTHTFPPPTHIHPYVYVRPLLVWRISFWPIFSVIPHVLLLLLLFYVYKKKKQKQKRGKIAAKKKLWNCYHFAMKIFSPKLPLFSTTCVVVFYYYCCCCQVSGHDSFMLIDYRSTQSRNHQRKKGHWQRYFKYAPFLISLWGQGMSMQRHKLTYKTPAHKCLYLSGFFFFVFLVCINIFSWSICSLEFMLWLWKLI